MKNIVLTICLLSILTIGAGCSAKPQTTTPTTTPQIIVKKKPDTEDTKTKAQNFCETKGYELIIRFNKTTQSAGSFCRFKDASECEVIEFYTGKCAPGNKNKIIAPAVPTKTDGLTICTTDYDPVCGANGFNYTNSCLTQAQGVKIAHNGVCIDKDIINAQENEQAIKVVEDTGGVQTNGTAVVEKLEPQNWLPIVKDLILANPQSDQPAFIEKCSVSGKTYYYRSDGCASCFTILYNNAGEPVCYPNNDMNGSCPTSFDKAYRAKHCTRVWQDPR